MTLNVNRRSSAPVSAARRRGDRLGTGRGKKNWFGELSRGNNSETLRAGEDDAFARLGEQERGGDGRERGEDACAERRGSRGHRRRRRGEVSGGIRGRGRARVVWGPSASNFPPRRQPNLGGGAVFGWVDLSDNTAPRRCVRRRGGLSHDRNRRVFARFVYYNVAR